MIKRIALSIFFLFAVSFLSAQTGDVSQPTVGRSIYNDTSIPLRDMVGIPVTSTNWEDGIIPLQEIPTVYRQYEKDLSLQDFNGKDGGGTIIQNFDGISAGAVGFAYVPPDVTCSVGPNHVMQMVNTIYQIWDKSGNSLYDPLLLEHFGQHFQDPGLQVLMMEIQ